MADEDDSDRWARAVRSFTGYPMPSRDGMFDGLTGDEPNGNAPLISVAIEDRDFMEMTESAYELYSGPNIDGHDFVIHFFSPPLVDPDDVDLDDYSDAELKEKVYPRLRKVVIDFVGPNGQDVKLDYLNPFGWGGSSDTSTLNGMKSHLGQYVEGAGNVLYELGYQNNITYDDIDFSSNGATVDRSQAMDFGTFTRTAEAYDRVAKFFVEHAETLKQWKESLGEDTAAWKGKAAEVFHDLIDGLHKNYSGFADQTHPKRFSAEHQSKWDWYVSSSKQGDAILGAGNAVLTAIRDLYQAWSDWESGTNVDWADLSTGEDPVEYLPGLGSPYGILYSMLQSASLWAYNHNARFAVKATKTGSKSTYYAGNTTGSGTWRDSKTTTHFYALRSEAEQVIPGLGWLHDVSTWAGLGTKAVASWNKGVEEYLIPAADTALSTVNNEFIHARRVLDKVLKPEVTSYFGGTDGSGSSGDTGDTGDDSAQDAIDDAEAKAQAAIDEANKAIDEANAKADAAIDKANAAAQAAADRANKAIDEANAKADAAIDEANAAAKKAIEDANNQANKSNDAAKTAIDDANAAANKAIDEANNQNQSIQDDANSQLKDTNNQANEAANQAKADANAAIGKANEAANQAIKDANNQAQSTTGEPNDAIVNNDSQSGFPVGSFIKNTSPESDNTGNSSRLTGGVTVQNPDGSVTTTYSDGTEVTKNPDGTVTQTDPDGTVTVSNPDGSVTVTNPDGSVQATGPGGNGSITTNPDDQTVVSGPSGKITVNPDGSTSVTGPSGSTKTSSNGTVTVTGPDGSTTVTSPDGSVQVTSPNGSVKVTNPDGNTTVRPPDGSVTVDNPNGSSNGSGNNVINNFNNNSSNNSSNNSGNNFSNNSTNNSGNSSGNNSGNGSSITTNYPNGSSGGSSGLGSNGSSYNSGGESSSDGYAYDDAAAAASSGSGTGSDGSTAGNPFVQGESGSNSSALGGSSSSSSSGSGSGSPMMPQMGGMRGGGESPTERERSSPGPRISRASIRRGSGSSQAAERRRTATTPDEELEEDMITTRSSTPFGPTMPPPAQRDQATQSDGDRERTAWMAEDEDVWGTDEGTTPAVIGR
ncbi:AAWKG family protein [Streptomyces sp. NPDC048277]|uniref:AAWKG family protein n=1 Tax=Streptomyces sp. NPDC048277 TaxID=3155027 RepID=UPI0033E760EE